MHASAKWYGPLRTPYGSEQERKKQNSYGLIIFKDDKKCYQCICAFQLQKNNLLLISLIGFGVSQTCKKLSM